MIVCFRLWEISKFVSKQLDKIGLTLSTTLVNAGLMSFEKLRGTSPRELELVSNNTVTTTEFEGLYLRMP